MRGHTKGEKAMSQQEPTGPYVYQPYGSVTHPDRAKTGRLYGVGGVDYAATISGLTKDEAQRVVAALDGTSAEAILRGLRANLEAHEEAPCYFSAEAAYGFDAGRASVLAKLTELDANPPTVDTARMTEVERG